MRRLALYLSLLAGMASCHTHRQTQPVTLTNTDSVRVETIVTTEYVPVTVEAPVPRQSVTNVTTDTSHIETDVAESNAWILPDGTLRHTLTNKPTTLTGTAHVPQTITQSNKEAVSTKEIPVPEPFPVYVEKQLSKAEQFKLAAFWYLVGAALLEAVYILRKPLLLLLRKKI